MKFKTTTEVITARVILEAKRMLMDKSLPSMKLQRN
jgi:hypothetical protein